MDKKLSEFEKRHQRVIDYIYDNLKGDLSLDTLADIACYSRFHWHRVYQSHTGESIAQTVRRLRLHKAANLLCQSELSLAEIANAVGIASAQSLSHGFRAAYGMPPAAYRQKGRAQVAHLARNKGNLTMYDVTITEHKPRRLAGIRHQGPYMEISRVFEKLWGIALSNGELFANSEVIGIYYSDPTALPPEEWQSAACMSLPANADAPNGTEIIEVSGGRYAELLLKGDYTGQEAAYRWLYGEWLPNSGETPREEPVFENYLNNPKDTAPKDLLTKICLPIQ